MPFRGVGLRNHPAARFDGAVRRLHANAPEVLEHIPIGTRIELAQAKMKEQGFHCQEWDANDPQEKHLTFTVAKPNPNATGMQKLNPFGHEVRVIVFVENGRVYDVKTYSYTAD